ncbi:unnamed protein product [uncultured bacterium]|nr:unnamed protein product [uncultured bacterium]
MTIPPNTPPDKGGGATDPRAGGPLLPRHLADLHGSGLSDEQIRRCGFYSASDPAAVAKLLGRADHEAVTALGPCLCIPFFGPDGRPLGYVRCKPDNPRVLDGKTVKYESPVGQPNRAYLPPATRAVLADPRVPLLVTEGEKKAARADQDGFACVGLVGVYGWQKKRPTDAGGKKTGSRELIPDLAAVAWAGRRVFVVYDSDLADKPEVLLAEWHLAGALRAAGADVRAVRLPPGAGGAKAGLDDFLLARGPDPLRGLLDAATPVTPPPEPRADPTAAPPRFAVGDRVSPTDRENVGTVTAVLSGNRYRVRFEGVDGTTEKVFPAAQLRPWPIPRTGPGATPPEPPRPYTPFPVEALPAPLRPFVRAVAAAIPCDPAAVALPVLVACGAAVGAARVLSIKNAWTEPPVVWGGLVARSGSVKSPPVEHAIGPLVTIDLELRRASNDAHRAFREAEQRTKEAERERKAADKRRGKGGDNAQGGEPSDPGTTAADDPGEPPPRLRCVAQDITVESLAVILSENPKGVLVYRDELASWFGSLTRYSKADTTADWLHLFHARTLTVDRKTGDRLTIAVPNAAASLVGTIQPRVLARAFTREFRASGGAARLLLVMPPPRQKVWTDDDVPAGVAADYERLIRRLRELEPHQDADRTTPVPVRFTDAARRRWGAFVNEWGRVTFEAGEEDDDLAAAFSKIEAYAGRLALVHHLVSLAGAGPVSGTEPVGLESLESGIALARWFASEAERVYAALVEDDTTARLRLLAERVRGLGGRVTVRDLQHSNSRKYRTAASAEAALAELVTAGWGCWEEIRQPGGGHPRREFVLRPTDDTSDTRPAGESDPPAAASDSRPPDGPGTPENQGESGRVSEVSCVGGADVVEDARGGPGESARASVGTPPPTGRARRYRSDDRPYESRG